MYTNVQIWYDNFVTGTLLFQANMLGNKITPQEYFNGGSDGLVPGWYAWRVRDWNPDTNGYGPWKETGVVVANYDYSPTILNLSCAMPTEWDVPAGHVHATIRGSCWAPRVLLEVSGPNGYFNEITLTNDLSNGAETGMYNFEYDLVLNVGSSVYTVRATGQNPKDERDAVEKWVEVSAVTPRNPDTTPVVVTVQFVDPVAPSAGLRLICTAASPVIETVSVYRSNYDGSTTAYENLPVLDGAFEIPGVTLAADDWITVNATSVYGKTSANTNVQMFIPYYVPRITDMALSGGPPTNILTFVEYPNSGPVATIKIERFNTGTEVWDALGTHAVGTGDVTVAGANFNTGQYIQVKGISAVPRTQPYWHIVLL